MGIFTKTPEPLKRAYSCKGGPLHGSRVVLSENSEASAWLVVRGEMGRYVVKNGGLIWEKRTTA